MNNLGPVAKAASVAAYAVAVGAFLVWTFSAQGLSGSKAFAQTVANKGNAVRKITKTGLRLDKATAKLARKGGEALTAHVLSVHSEIPESELLSRPEGVSRLGAISIVSRATHQSIDEVVTKLQTGATLGQVVVSAGISSAYAQTLLTSTLVGVNSNTRSLAGGTHDSDRDGVENSMDDDVDGDGTPNGQDDDVDDDGMSNSDDDDVDGDGQANGDDDDIDGDDSANSSDSDDDGDSMDDDSDDDSDGDGVDDSNEDVDDDNGNDNGNANGNGNDDNGNANDDNGNGNDDNGNANDDNGNGNDDDDNGNANDDNGNGNDDNGNSNDDNGNDNGNGNGNDDGRGR
jgi:hypothetical protein